MSLWNCLACGTRYAVGLLRCPHCHATDYEEDGMAKITVADGPSHAPSGEAVPAAAAPEAEEQAAAPVTPEPETAPEPEPEPEVAPEPEAAPEPAAAEEPADKPAPSLSRKTE